MCRGVIPGTWAACHR